MVVVVVIVFVVYSLVCFWPNNGNYTKVKLSFFIKNGPIIVGKLPAQLDGKWRFFFDYNKHNHHFQYMSVYFIEPHPAMKLLIKPKPKPKPKPTHTHTREKKEKEKRKRNKNSIKAVSGFELIATFNIYHICLMILLFSQQQHEYLWLLAISQ